MDGHGSTDGVRRTSALHMLQSLKSPGAVFGPASADRKRPRAEPATSEPPPTRSKMAREEEVTGVRLGGATSGSLEEGKVEEVGAKRKHAPPPTRASTSQESTVPAVSKEGAKGGRKGEEEKKGKGPELRKKPAKPSQGQGGQGAQGQERPNGGAAPSRPSGSRKEAAEPLAAKEAAEQPQPKRKKDSRKNVMTVDTMAHELVTLSTQGGKEAGVLRLAELMRLHEMFQHVIGDIKEAPTMQRHATAHMYAGHLVRVRTATDQVLKAIARCEEREGDDIAE